MFKLDPLNVKAINEETLPEASRLANGLLTRGADVANQTLTQVAGVLSDTLTQGDAIGGRVLDRAERIGGNLLDRAEAIVERLEGGLEVKGTIGGIPVDLVLALRK